MPQLPITLQEQQMTGCDFPTAKASRSAEVTQGRLRLFLYHPPFAIPIPLILTQAILQQMAPEQECRQIGSHLQEHSEPAEQTALARQEPHGVEMWEEIAIVAFLPYCTALPSQMQSIGTRDGHCPPER